MTTAICIASGASLTKSDVEYCRGEGRIYVVKECHLLAPWADVLYAADEDWWDFNKGVPEFKGEKWTVSREASQKWDLNYVPGDSQIEWGTSLDLIAYGGNSGFQALNLAVLQGASRVILLGYDMQFTSGRKHWHTGKVNRPMRGSNYADWLKRFDKAAPHIPVPVFNASRNSAIKCFPKVTLTDIL